MLGTGGDEFFAAFVRAEMEGFPGALGADRAFRGDIGAADRIPDELAGPTAIGDRRRTPRRAASLLGRECLAEKRQGAQDEDENDGNAKEEAHTDLV